MHSYVTAPAAAAAHYLNEPSNAGVRTHLGRLVLVEHAGDGLAEGTAGEVGGQR